MVNFILCLFVVSAVDVLKLLFQSRFVTSAHGSLETTLTTNTRRAGTIKRAHSHWIKIVGVTHQCINRVDLIKQLNIACRLVSYSHISFIAL